MPWIRMEKELQERKWRRVQKTKEARDTFINDVKEIGAVTVIAIETGIADQAGEVKEEVP